MLNEKQKVIQEKLQDIYRVIKVENIEDITKQVTEKVLGRKQFLDNLVTFMIGYCYELIEDYQLTTSEDFNVSYVLETISSAETDTLDATVFLLEWAISKLALSFRLDPNMMEVE